MPHLSWTTAAAGELYRLYQYHSDQNAVHAASMIDTIMDEVQILRNFPAIGRLTDDGSSNRELIIRYKRRAYIVMYEILHDVVSILSVRDGRREERQVIP